MIGIDVATNAVTVADIRVSTGEVAAVCATDCVEAVVVVDVAGSAPGHLVYRRNYYSGPSVNRYYPV